MVVLVVDDDAVSRLVAEHILRSGGHNVIGAESAEDALVVLYGTEQDTVQLIVCDYHMPGASGLDLLDQLHCEEVLDPCPPFVLLTGVGEEDELDDDRASQVSAYLTKPVQSGELLELAASLTAACVE